METSQKIKRRKTLLTNEIISFSSNKLQTAWIGSKFSKGQRKERFFIRTGALPGGFGVFVQETVVVPAFGNLIKNEKLYSSFVFANIFFPKLPCKLRYIPLRPALRYLCKGDSERLQYLLFWLRKRVACYRCEI